MSTEITNNPSQKENGSTTKILIIDDDPAILEVMDNYFSTKGFTPLLAEEGRAGLELFARAFYSASLLLRKNLCPSLNPCSSKIANISKK